jgi:WD40 repeat-containing protein SMU1
MVDNEKTTWLIANTPFFLTNSVIKLVIQFLRENNLSSTLSTLEKESNQSLNTVEDKAKFTQDILDGRWDVILKQVNHLGLSNEKLFDLYEQV